MTKTPKQVTFAPVLHTSTGEIDPPTTDQNETPTESLIVTKWQKTEEPSAQEIREESTVPPPGFRPFRWPRADWDDIGDATLDPGLEFVASWSARIMEERSSPPPLIPLSPITAEDSQDSIMVQIGSPISELYTPAGLDRFRSVNRRRPRRPMKMSTKCEKPAPAEDFLFRDIFCEPGTITNRSLSESTGNIDRGRVPRWRLDREGPFPNERSQASLRVLGKGCAFRHTTYNVEEHAPPSSGNPPGEVPSDCFPRMDETGMTKTPKRVTFAPVLHTSTGEIDPPTTDQNETPTESPIVMKRQKTEEPRAQEIREESTVPPPGFRPFRWPRADWDDIGDATLDPGLEFVASWSARIMEERSSPPPLIPLSPITAEDSQDSIMVQIGSPISELYTPAGLDQFRSVKSTPATPTDENVD